MDEDNNEVLVPLEQPIRDGHKIVYSVRRKNPFVFEGIFHELKHETLCRTTPTSRLMVLGCERVAKGGFYSFKSTLRRRDDSNIVVKVNYSASFFDAKGMSVVPAISKGRDRFSNSDKLEKLVLSIHPAYVRPVVLVKVTLEIEHCHEDDKWQCESKFITDKNGINQKTKL